MTAEHVSRVDWAKREMCSWILILCRFQKVWPKWRLSLCSVPFQSSSLCVLLLNQCFPPKTSSLNPWYESMREFQWAKIHRLPVTVILSIWDSSIWASCSPSEQTLELTKATQKMAVKKLESWLSMDSQGMGQVRVHGKTQSLFNLLCEKGPRTIMYTGLTERLT